jgi:hypothetical protein
MIVIEENFRLGCDAVQSYIILQMFRRTLQLQGRQVNQASCWLLAWFIPRPRRSSTFLPHVRKFLHSPSWEADSRSAFQDAWGCHWDLKVSYHIDKSKHDPAEFVRALVPCFFKVQLRLSSHLHPGRRFSASSRFQIDAFCVFSNSVIRAIYTVHPIVLDLISLIIFGEGTHYTVFSGLLSISLSWVEILRPDMFWKAINLCIIK